MGMFDVPGEKERMEAAKSRITCPNCHTNNVEPITTGEKRRGVFWWGVGGLPKMDKSWRCKDCSHVW